MATSAKRKLSDEPGRKFVHKTQWSEVSDTICVEIQDFTGKIDDLDNKQKPIFSPNFTLGGKELCVGVMTDPNDPDPEFIGVYLMNFSKEDITASAKFKSSSGGKSSIKNQVIKAGSGRGSPKFLSHAAFKKWAKEYEDIFILEVEVTLHVKGPATWTTER